MRLLETLLVDKTILDVATGYSNILDQQVAQYMTEGVVCQCLDAETELAPASREGQKSLFLGTVALHQ